MSPIELRMRQVIPASVARNTHFSHISRRIAELARDSNTKATADPKVGDKVTVHYTMTATNIEVKPAKAEKGAKKEASPAASPKK